MMAESPTPGWQPRPGGVEPPAGWYPDPTGRFRQRYWQGDRWTSRVRMGRAEATDHGVDTNQLTQFRAELQGSSPDATSPTSASAQVEQQGGSWHPDPTGRFEQRQWSGERWSRQIRVGQAEATDTLSVPHGIRPPAGVHARAPTRTSSSPAGWRPDPQDPRFERYWDGYEWTAKRRQEGTTAAGWRPRQLKVALLAVVLVVLALIAVTVGLVVG